MVLTTSALPTPKALTDGRAVTAFALLSLWSALLFSLPSQAQIQPPPRIIATGADAVDSRLLSPDVPRDSRSAGVSAFACSIRTLRTDQSCVLTKLAEPNQTTATPARAKRRANEAKAIFAEVCDDVAVSPRTLCKDTPAAMLNACAKVSTLRDESGRFTRAAKDCYEAIASALDDVRSASTSGGGCCGCAASCDAELMCHSTTVAAARKRLRGSCVERCRPMCQQGGAQ